MNERPLVVRAPRRLVVLNRKSLSTHLCDRIDEGYRDLVLSFEQTRLIDSTGLAMLAGLHRHVTQERSGRIRVSALSDEMRLAFGAARLDQKLEIVDTAEGETDPWHAPEDGGIWM